MGQHNPLRYIYRKSPGLDSPGEKTGLPEQKKTAADIPAAAIFRNCLPSTPLGTLSPWIYEPQRSPAAYALYRNQRKNIPLADGETRSGFVRGEGCTETARSSETSCRAYRLRRILIHPWERGSQKFFQHGNPPSCPALQGGHIISDRLKDEQMSKYYIYYTKSRSEKKFYKQYKTADGWSTEKSECWQFSEEAARRIISRKAEQVEKNSFFKRYPENKPEYSTELV